MYGFAYEIMMVMFWGVTLEFVNSSDFWSEAKKILSRIVFGIETLFSIFFLKEKLDLAIRLLSKF